MRLYLAGRPALMRGFDAWMQADLFGRALAMNSNTALIGAPNRDYFYSGINCGAAFFTDLGFVNVRFESREYEVCSRPTLACSPQCTR
jgi:hypothetical protein